MDHCAAFVTMVTHIRWITDQAGGSSVILVRINVRGGRENGTLGKRLAGLQRDGK